MNDRIIREKNHNLQRQERRVKNLAKCKGGFYRSSADQYGAHAVDLFALIHSADRLSLAQEINKAAEKK